MQKNYLPGRTVDAIVGRASDLGITSEKNPNWTKEEDEILREHYGKMPNKELQAKYLSDRTTKAIVSRAAILDSVYTRRKECDRIEAS